MGFGWLFFCAVVCLGCGEAVIIGDNGQLAGTEAGADAQAPVEAGDAQHEPEAYVPVLTASSVPKDMNSMVNTKDKYVPGLWFDLDGDELYDRTVAAVRVTHSGGGKASGLKVTLCDETFQCFAPPEYFQSFDPQTQQTVFQGLQIKVPAKAKVHLVFIENFDTEPNEKHTLSIAQPTDITVSEGAEVKGTFPVQGPIFVTSDDVYFRQLSYGLDDPPEKTIQAGQQDALLFAFWAKSVHYTISTTGWGFGLHAQDTNMICGSQGRMVIKNVRVWENGEPISNPMDLDAQVTLPAAKEGTFATYGEMIGQVTFEPGKMQHYEVRGDVTANEDAPGEFFGQSYNMSLQLPPYASDIMLFTFADMLNPGAVSPPDDLQGKPFTLLAP